MRRQPSLSLRVLRGLVVLVTVWCTGCAGFEPLLDAVLGKSQTGMVCASEKGAPNGTGQMPASSAGSGGQSSPAISALPTSPVQRGFSCGCMSCQAVAPAVWSFALLPAQAIPPVAATELPLVSVGRVPLLPPPERAVA